MNTNNLRVAIRKIILENWDAATPENIEKFNQEYLSRPIDPNSPSYIGWTDSKNYREIDFLNASDEDKWPHPYYIGGKGQSHWIVRSITKHRRYRGGEAKEDYWFKDCKKNQVQGVLQTLRKQAMDDHLKKLGLSNHQIRQYKDALKKADGSNDFDELGRNSLSRWSNYNSASSLVDLDFGYMSISEIIEAVPPLPVKFHIRGPFTTESIISHIRDNLAGRTQEVEFTFKKKQGGPGKWWKNKKK